MNKRGRGLAGKEAQGSSGGGNGSGRRTGMGSQPLEHRAQVGGIHGALQVRQVLAQGGLPLRGVLALQLLSAVRWVQPDFHVLQPHYQPLELVRIIRIHGARILQ